MCHSLVSASAAATASGLVDCGVCFFSTDASGVTACAHVVAEQRRVLRATRRAQVVERASLLEQPPHERADDFVRVAERQSLGDEVVGDVGREQQARRGARR